MKRTMQKKREMTPNMIIRYDNKFLRENKIPYLQAQINLSKITFACIYGERCVLRTYMEKSIPKFHFKPHNK